MTKSVILHLGLVVAGWGIVAVVGPPLKTMREAEEHETFAAPTKTDRVRMDPVGGQRLLERLRREVAPSAELDLPFEQISISDRINELIAQIDPQGERPVSADDPRYWKHAILAAMAEVVSGSGGPDYSYAFRHGRMEAHEILQLLAERMPEHADDPYFPVMLYHCLVREDPGRAEPLLAGLSPREQARQHDSLLGGRPPVLGPAVLGPTAGGLILSWGAPDPAFAMALLANIPWQRESYRQFDHAWVWRTCAYQFCKSDDYLTWLKSLPPGQDRDFALATALEHAQNPYRIYRTTPESR